MPEQHALNTLHITAMVMTLVSTACGAFTGLVLAFWGIPQNLDTSSILLCFLVLGGNIWVLRLLTGVSPLLYVAPETGIMALNIGVCAVVMFFTNPNAPLFPTLGMALWAALTWAALYRVLQRPPPRPQEPLL